MNAKQTIDWHETDERPLLECKSDIIVRAMDMLQQHFHAASYNRGWWHDPVTGLSLIPGDFDAWGDLNTEQLPDDGMFGNPREIIRQWFPYVIATKIALIHSEVSEMLESVRTGAMDDKLPELPGVTAEGADVVIRVLDLMGMLAMAPEHAGFPLLLANDEPFNLGHAILAKGAFNVVRPDHALEARAKPGGKKY